MLAQCEMEASAADHIIILAEQMQSAAVAAAAASLQSFVFSHVRRMPGSRLSQYVIALISNICKSSKLRASSCLTAKIYIYV